MSPHRRNILFFVLLLVCVRAALLLSLVDAFGIGEEFSKSGAAKAMIDGLPVEHYQLAYGYHEGGGFFVSHLEALGFLLLGPCVLVVKLSAVGFAIATLISGAWMLADHVSARAAYLFAAFFAFAPESFQRLSLLSLGTHIEACVFLLLAFHFTAKTVRGDGASKWAPFWMGVCGGFGCWVGLQMPPALLVCGIVILANVRGKALWPVAGRALLGFAIGALPLWWMMSHVGLYGLVPHRANQAADRPSFLASLPMIIEQILQSKDPLTWLHSIAFVVTIAWGLVIRRTMLQWILLAYLLVFVVGWGASGLAKPFNPAIPWFDLIRVVPPWTVVTLLAAIGVDTLLSQGGVKRALAIATAAIAIAAGIRGTISLIAASKPDTPLENARLLATARGYTYQEYFVQLSVHFAGGIDHNFQSSTPLPTMPRAEKVKVLMLSHDDPAYLAPDVVDVMYGMPAFNAPKGTTDKLIENVLPEITEVFGPHRDLALLGAGKTVNGFYDFDTNRAFAKLETLPEDVREPLAEALGRTGVTFYFRTDKWDQLFSVVPPERWHDAWFRGIGWRVHMTYRFRPDLARATLAKLAERERVPATIGFERALQLDRIR